MRKEDAVHPLDPRAQRLLSEVRRGVDDHAAISVLYINRGPQPLVARIVGTAHRAMAADGRNPYASARTEHRDAQGINSHLLASLLFGRSLRGFLVVLLHGLDATKTQLRKSVVRKPRFSRRQIPARLLLKHGSQATM